jgi:hypothetical protein
MLCRRGEPDDDRLDADLVACTLLMSHVDLRGDIIADEHDRKRGVYSSGFEGLYTLRHL